MNNLAFTPAIDIPLTCVTLLAFLYHFNSWARQPHAHLQRRFRSTFTNCEIPSHFLVCGAAVRLLAGQLPCMVRVCVASCGWHCGCLAFRRRWNDVGIHAVRGRLYYPRMVVRISAVILHPRAQRFASNIWRDAPRTARRTRKSCRAFTPMWAGRTKRTCDIGSCRSPASCWTSVRRSSISQVTKDRICVRPDLPYAVRFMFTQRLIPVELCEEQFSREKHMQLLIQFVAVPIIAGIRLSSVSLCVGYLVPGDAGCVRAGVDVGSCLDV